MKKNEITFISKKELHKTRRQFLKIICAGMSLGIATTAFPSLAALPANNKRVLIAWFSRSGNTQHIAQYIHSRIGGDMFEVKATHAYPEKYRATTRQARKELDDNYRPTLTNQVSNFADYDLIILGYPNWWGTMPMAVFTFLESYNFSGKQILPFCTHEGSQMGRSPQDIQQLAPSVHISEGLPLRGASVQSDSAHAAVQRWLTLQGLAQ
ncbi:flavodoxin [Salmonella enterica subsp. enterica serovar Bonariensis]|nr:flavodoxin [Salmonella enterica subsp. enterica serovar Bonariensis]